MLKRGLLFLLIIIGFNACNNELSDEKKELYTKKGDEIKSTSFKEMSGKLMEKMQEGGPALAIPFCNLEALPITNKLSEQFNVEIKRTSDKLRNVNNSPTKRELELINKYKSSLINNEVLNPVIELDSTGNPHYYAPIIVKANCLNCHGKFGETLSIKTDSIIKFLYPKDLAINYKENDLRGIWSVKFKKSER